MPHQFASNLLPVQPICELCKAEAASCFTSLGVTTDGKLTDWKFCGGCDDSTDNYLVTLDDFFENPGSTTEELAELHRRGNDWQNFMDMMVRFQAATRSFDQ